MFAKGTCVDWVLFTFFAMSPAVNLLIPSRLRSPSLIASTKDETQEF